MLKSAERIKTFYILVSLNSKTIKIWKKFLI